MTTQTIGSNLKHSILVRLALTIALLTSVGPARRALNQPASADEGTTFTQKQKLIAPNGVAGDFFGQAVAIEGTTAVVGAFKDKAGSGSNPGQAYVFVRTGGTWALQQELSAGPGEDGNRFGVAMAISGSTIVIGAPTDDIGANASQGSAYVFVRSNGTWSLQQKITASDGNALYGFGSSVAIRDDTIAVGVLGKGPQGFVCVFTRQNGVWTEKQQITSSDGDAGDLFGKSVAFTSSELIVGSYSDDIGSVANQGSAYVFKRTGDIWIETQKIAASDGASGDFFGNSASCTEDTLVIGAFSRKESNPTTIGSAYVFKRTNGIWVEQQKLLPEDGGDNEGFGGSVAISGNRIVIGAFNFDVEGTVRQGGAFVFSESNGVWTKDQRLIADDGASQDTFGISVAISADSIIVGARDVDIATNEDQGGAYIFSNKSVPDGPTIENIEIDGKRLVITGSNFESPTEIYVDGQKQKKTFNDDLTPTTSVYAKKGGKAILPGTTVMVQVRNSNTGVTSSEVPFTRSLE